MACAFKIPTSQPIHVSGSPVRVTSFLSFVLLSNLVVAQSSPTPGVTQNIDTQAVTTTELVAWMAGGVSSSRLARLVGERGLATLPTNLELRQLELAGAGKSLMNVLRLGNTFSAKIGPPIPAKLMKAAAEVRRQQFAEAEVDLREVVGSEGQKSALHFALGVVYRQEEKWDEAFDELSRATRLMPALGKLPMVTSWAGLRPATPDRLPYLGKGPVDGLIVATGHYRNGILLAPITAELVADLLAGQPPSVDLAPFNPLRVPERIESAG